MRTGTRLLTDALLRYSNSHYGSYSRGDYCLLQTDVYTPQNWNSGRIERKGHEHKAA